MKLVIVSTFWNAGKYVSECIESLKKQYYTNFSAYFIDDMSTDDSYEIAKKTIGNDERFILIKNTEKKYKTKNFIDVIRNNDKIFWDDVIVEIDGDDKLADKFVLGRINKVFSDDNIWLCGTRFKDRNGRLGNYSRPQPDKARTTIWNFSHMRSYRAFLFRQIRDEHLKYNGEYFKASCDIGFAVPMMEMSGEEHFYYIDEPLYIYTWHDRQSYSNKNSFGDDKLQSKIGYYIYANLPKYDKIIFTNPIEENNEFEIQKQRNNNELLNQLFKGGVSNKERITIDYDKINQLQTNKKIYIRPTKKEDVKPNIPKYRNDLITIKKGSLAQTTRDISGIKKNLKNNLQNIFGKK